MSKLLILLSLFMISNILYSKEKKSEKELFVQAIKEEQSEDQLKEDKTFDECKEMAQAQSEAPAEQKKLVQKCYGDKINALEDKELETISKKMNLKSYDRDAAKSTQSVKEYLQKRLDKAIFGKSDDLKKTKITDHKVYLDLYESQVGKNILLEISQYCLENLGRGRDKYSINIAGTSYNVVQREKDNYAVPVIVEGTYEYEATKSGSLCRGGCSISEYTVCRKSTPKSCSENERHPDLIALLKRKLFEVAESDPAKILGKRYETCALKVKDMCEIYRCQNTYNANTPPQVIEKCMGRDYLNLTSPESKKEYREKIQKRSGSSIGFSVNKEGGEKGSIACNLEGKLKDYRRTLLALEETKGQFEEMRRAKTGFSSKDGSFEIEQKKLSDSKINKVTSISSTELTSKVGEIEGAEEKAKELKEKCFEDGKFNEEDKDCLELSTNLDKEKLESIKEEEEVETAVYLKKIEELKSEGKKEELDKFLKEHGLENYVGSLGELSEEQMVQVIKDKYKAERMAAIESLNQRYAKERKIKKDEDGNIEESDIENTMGKIAEENLNDIKNHKKRVETLFQYSNIISSYLEIKTGEGDEAKVGGSNYMSRNIEIEDLKKGEGSEVADADILKRYSAGGEDAGSGNEGSKAIVDINFLDQVLGNAANKEEDGVSKN